MLFRGPAPRAAWVLTGGGAAARESAAFSRAAGPVAWLPVAWLGCGYSAITFSGSDFGSSGRSPFRPAGWPLWSVESPIMAGSASGSSSG